MVICAVQVVHGSVNQQLPVAGLVGELRESRLEAYALAVLHKAPAVFVCLISVQRCVPVFKREHLTGLIRAERNAICFRLRFIHTETVVQIRQIRVALQNHMIIRIQPVPHHVAGQDAHAKIHGVFLCLCGLAVCLVALRPCIIGGSAHLFANSVHHGSQRIATVSARMPWDDEADPVIGHGQLDMIIVDADEDHLYVVVLPRLLVGLIEIDAGHGGEVEHLVAVFIHMPSVALWHDAQIDLDACRSEHVHRLNDLGVQLAFCADGLHLEEGHHVVYAPFRPVVARALESLSANQVLCLHAPDGVLDGSLRLRVIPCQEGILDIRPSVLRTLDRVSDACAGMRQDGLAHARSACRSVCPGLFVLVVGKFSCFSQVKQDVLRNRRVVRVENYLSVCIANVLFAQHLRHPVVGLNVGQLVLQRLCLLHERFNTLTLCCEFQHLLFDSGELPFDSGFRLGNRRGWLSAPVAVPVFHIGYIGPNLAFAHAGEAILIACHVAEQAGNAHPATENIAYRAWNVVSDARCLTVGIDHLLARQASSELHHRLAHHVHNGLRFGADRAEINRRSVLLVRVILDRGEHLRSGNLPDHGLILVLGCQRRQVGKHLHLCIRCILVNRSHSLRSANQVANRRIRQHVRRDACHVVAVLVNQAVGNAVIIQPHLKPCRLCQLTDGELNAARVRGFACRHSVFSGSLPLGFFSLLQRPPEHPLHACQLVDAIALHAAQPADEVADRVRNPSGDAGFLLRQAGNHVLIAGEDLRHDLRRQLREGALFVHRARASVRIGLVVRPVVLVVLPDDGRRVCILLGLVAAVPQRKQRLLKGVIGLCAILSKVRQLMRQHPDQRLALRDAFWNVHGVCGALIAALCALQPWVVVFDHLRAEAVQIGEPRHHAQAVRAGCRAAGLLLRTLPGNAVLQGHAFRLVLRRSGLLSGNPAVQIAQLRLILLRGVRMVLLDVRICIHLADVCGLLLPDARLLPLLRRRAGRHVADSLAVGGLTRVGLRIGIDGRHAKALKPLRGDVLARLQLIIGVRV